MLAHRQAVRDLFEIPWTAITPRMQRLLYAINAIVQPRNMLAAGVFCGNTFISNAGAAVGAGAVYTARNLIGVEIVAREAERAERNVRRLDPTGVARVLAADAVDIATEFQEPVNLLYLDADGTGGRGKGVYLDILEACYERMPGGTVVLAHNSYNCAEMLKYYLEYVTAEGGGGNHAAVTWDAGTGAFPANGTTGLAIDPNGLDLQQALQLAGAGDSLNPLHRHPALASIAEFIQMVPADVLFENSPVNHHTGQPAASYLQAARELVKKAGAWKKDSGLA